MAAADTWEDDDDNEDGRELETEAADLIDEVG